MSEIVNGNPLDKNQSRKTKVKATRFPLNQRIFGTYRFGEEGIFLMHDGLAGDKQTNIRSVSNIDTYTLKAPLLNSITMNKTIIQVNRCAILPNAWEKIFVNPSIGEDIDATKYGTSVSAQVWTNFLRKLITECKNSFQIYYGEQTPIHFKKFTKDLVNLEYIFSRGSLLNALGCNMAALWYRDIENGLFEGVGRNFDTFFETMYTVAISSIKLVYVYNNKRFKIGYGPGVSGKKATWNEYLNLMREDAQIEIPSFTGYEISEDSYNSLKNNLDYFAANIIYTKPIDIAPLWAYQMACAEFFTNDKVDYVYNGELFRQYIKNLWIEAEELGGQGYQNFNYELNGIKFENDGMNALVFERMSEILNGPETTEESIEKVNAYLTALFGYRRSLKYKDYFTGARTRPIAIGNTDIEVQLGDTVEVIDVVAAIQKQRFLNIVNKIPRDLKGYTKGIFGKDVAPDWHNPLFICRVSEPIYGQEIENTGEAQITQAVSRTTVLKNKGRQLRFELNGFDRNTILIGFVDFDIARAYSDGVDRLFMNVDRFDYYNPFLQYTGDQEIYMEELDAKETGTFGYTGAYMERKQKYNRAFGGFVTALPGWTFLESYVNDTAEDGSRVEKNSISPDYIRSKSTELDKFYISLSGHSLANYFHFIIDTYNEISAVRPMSYNPQILE